MVSTWGTGHLEACPPPLPVWPDVGPLPFGVGVGEGEREGESFRSVSTVLNCFWRSANIATCWLLPRTSVTVTIGPAFKCPGFFFSNALNSSIDNFLLSFFGEALFESPPTAVG